MPVTSSAAKALRRDRRRQAANRPLRDRLKVAVKKARRKPSAQNLAAAYRALDRAAKKGVIHPNRAARLKSRLAALTPRARKGKRAKTPAKKALPRAKKKAKKSA